MIFTHWSFCDFLLRLGWGIWIWCRNSKVQYIQGNLWRRTLFKLTFLHSFLNPFRILDADSKDAAHFHIKWQSPTYLHLDCSAKLTHYAGSSSLDSAPKPMCHTVQLYKQHHQPRTKLNNLWTIRRWATNWYKYFYWMALSYIDTKEMILSDWRDPAIVSAAGC